MSEQQLFKQCPDCQQFSPEESGVCLQCGHNFTPVQAPKETRGAGGLESLSRQPPKMPEVQTRKRRKGCVAKVVLWTLAIVVLFIVIGMIGAALSGNFDDPTASERPSSTPVPTFTSTPADSTAFETTGQTHTQAQEQPTTTSVPPTPEPPTPVRPTATPIPQPMVTVNNDINVRGGPGTNYPIIGTASAGQQFPITGKNHAGDWWEITYNERGGWVYGPLVTAINRENVEVTVRIPPTPRPPTPTRTPRPTRTPIVTLDKTERANMWVYISNNEYFMLVYADPAFDIEKFELDLFVDGREYGHSNKIYADEGPRKLSGGPEQRSHTSVQRVSAQTPAGDLSCERHVESNSEVSVFACVFRTQSR